MEGDERVRGGWADGWLTVGVRWSYAWSEECEASWPLRGWAPEEHPLGVGRLWAETAMPAMARSSSAKRGGSVSRARTWGRTGLGLGWESVDREWLWLMLLVVWVVWLVWLVWLLWLSM